MHLEHRCIMYAAFFGAFIYVNERKLEYSSCVCLYRYREREREKERERERERERVIALLGIGLT